MPETNRGPQKVVRRPKPLPKSIVVEKTPEEVKEAQEGLQNLLGGLDQRQARGVPLVLEVEEDSASQPTAAVPMPEMPSSQSPDLPSEVQEQLLALAKPAEVSLSEWDHPEDAADEGPIKSWDDFVKQRPDAGDPQAQIDYVMELGRLRKRPEKMFREASAQCGLFPWSAYPKIVQDGLKARITEKMADKERVEQWVKFLQTLGVPSSAEKKYRYLRLIFAIEGLIDLVEKKASPRT